MRADESWDENAMGSWIQQLSEIKATLKATRTCARLLSGGRDDKQLYSESVIYRCVDTFKSVTEAIVIPLVELWNSGPCANLLKMVRRHKKAIASVFVCYQGLCAVLAKLVTKIELPESVIITLEFTALKLLFAENAYLGEDSAIEF
ncbi:Sister chromatid cohesion protein 2 [Purpureocillium takamizusanense]|uniref:Sister chromatid cohesion protein 2 n=1 Tax=Purpureocillium takamizusanense TaxID=2060973 RepID=A0A9Q8QDZ6_9HYPO|nr:Sister chromatid cohesion protein 2 [Purpureocillium takamizusanense]UNI17161.1 Sister chromatid cohesion protein 2 [Purpureocillium takamizusanense]